MPHSLYCPSQGWLRLGDTQPQTTRSSTKDPCIPVQGWLLAAHAAVLATLATAAWLLRPPRRTYLVDWYSFRPPDRMAVSIDDMKDGIERKKVGSGLAPDAISLYHNPWASTRAASGLTSLTAAMQSTRLEGSGKEDERTMSCPRYCACLHYNFYRTRHNTFAQSGSRLCRRR